MSVLELAGRRRRFQNTEYWAEQGMVRCVDVTRPDLPPVGTKPKEFLTRAFQFYLLSKLQDYPSKRIEYENTSHDMKACAEEAAAQGDPTNQDIQQFWATHRTFVTQYSLVGDLPQDMGRRR